MQGQPVSRRDRAGIPLFLTGLLLCSCLFALFAALSRYGHRAVALPEAKAETPGKRTIEVAWEREGGLLSVQQSRGRVYRVNDGILVCMDSETGAEIWRSRLKGSGYQAVSVGDGGLLVQSWTDTRPATMRSHFEGVPWVTAWSAGGARLWETRLPRCSGVSVHALPGVVLVTSVAYQAKRETQTTRALSIKDGHQLWSREGTRVEATWGRSFAILRSGARVECVRFSEGGPEPVWRVEFTKGESVAVTGRADAASQTGCPLVLCALPFRYQGAVRFIDPERGTFSEPLRVPDGFSPRFALGDVILGETWSGDVGINLETNKVLWRRGGELAGIGDDAAYLSSQQTTKPSGSSEAPVWGIAHLECVSLRTGQRRWRADMGTKKRMGTIPVACEQGPIVWVNLYDRLLAFDKKTGARLWNSDSLGPRVSRASVQVFDIDYFKTMGPILDVVTYEGACYFRAAKTGIFALRLRKK